MFGLLAPASLSTSHDPPHSVKREQPPDAFTAHLDPAALAALAPRTSEYRSLSTTQRPSTAPAPVQSDPSGTSIDDAQGELGGPEGDRKTRFVYKLHRMVEDPECQDTIAWSPAGNSVIISDVDAFCAGVLGKHFKHNNFSSFIRQLDMYGFYKVNKSHRAARASGQPQTWEFSHASFRRGRTDLLETIRRRTLDTESVRYEATRDLQNDMSMSYARLQSQLSSVSDALAASQAENVTLWSFVAQLRSTLSQVVDRTNLANVVPVPAVPAHRATLPTLDLPVHAEPPPIFAHALPPLAPGGGGPSATHVPLHHHQHHHTAQMQHNPTLAQLSRPMTAPSMSQHIPHHGAGTASMLLRSGGAAPPPSEPTTQSGAGASHSSHAATSALYRAPSVDHDGLFGSQPFAFTVAPRPRPPQSGADPASAMPLPSSTSQTQAQVQAQAQAQAQAHVSQYANIQLAGAPPGALPVPVPTGEPPLKRRAVEADMVSNFGFSLS